MRTGAHVGPQGRGQLGQGAKPPPRGEGPRHERDGLGPEALDEAKEEAFEVHRPLNHAAWGSIHCASQRPPYIITTSFAQFFRRWCIFAVFVVVLDLVIEVRDVIVGGCFDLILFSFVALMVFVLLF